jgi:lipoprotein signal peptidase
MERYRTGCVVDYINFFDLFLFNIYDMIVTVGVSILAIIQLFDYGKTDTNSGR